jgi:hypothetical protein
METPIQKTRCLKCDAILDTVGDLEHGRGPQHGDPVVCLRCGSVMIFDHNGVRPFTRTETEELYADQEIMAAIRRLVGLVRAFQSMKN